MPQPLALTLLKEALEQLSGEAFVVGGGGVLLANRLGQRRMQGPDGLMPSELVELARAGDNPRVKVVTLTRREAGDVWECHLVLFRAQDQVEQLWRSATSRWGLTRRQGAVLRHLVDGESNKGIANLLGCSEATIELHVTGILGRAGVDSRTRLIASFYRGDTSP